jgi:hypothetical protein
MCSHVIISEYLQKVHFFGAKYNDEDNGLCFSSCQVHQRDSVTKWYALQSNMLAIGGQTYVSTNMVVVSLAHTDANFVSVKYPIWMSSFVFYQLTLAHT